MSSGKQSPNKRCALGFKRCLRGKDKQGVVAFDWCSPRSFSMNKFSRMYVDGEGETEILQLTTANF